MEVKETSAMSWSEHLVLQMEKQAQRWEVTQPVTRETQVSSCPSGWPSAPGGRVLASLAPEGHSSCTTWVSYWVPDSVTPRAFPAGACLWPVIR